MQDVIASADDAAGGVDDEFAVRILFEGRQLFVERGDFFSQIVRFALGIRWTIGPAHPCGNTVDALIPTGFEDGGETSFDQVVAANRGTAESVEILDPMGFAGAGHADEREAKRLIGIRPHGEWMILRNSLKLNKSDI